METNLAHELKVGLFTLIGIVLLCVSVILLGGDKLLFSHTYALKIRMPQVQGLARGSVVSLSGVPIGNVDKITFAEGTNEVEVVIGIERNVQSKITQGSMVTVKTQGALGDKYVYIEPGPLTATPLQEGTILPMDKVPDFLDILASKGAELGEVVEVIKEVRILFQNINKDSRSSKLMANLVEDTDLLGKFLSEGRETFKLVRGETLTPLASVMKKLDKGQGTLGALINDPSLHSRLMGMLGEAPRNKFLKPLIRDSIQTNEGNK